MKPETSHSSIKRATKAWTQTYTQTSGSLNRYFRALLKDVKSPAPFQRKFTEVVPIGSNQLFVSSRFYQSRRCGGTHGARGWVAMVPSDATRDANPGNSNRDRKSALCHHHSCCKLLRVFTLKPKCEQNPQAAH